MTSTETTAIVGGGMLGLGIARRLAEAGHPVSVFEAQPSIGGLTAAWQLGEVTWDKHYHVTLMSDSHTRELLRWLDLEDEIVWATTKTGCYGAGELHSISNVLEYLTFPLLNILQKVRLGTTILRAATISNWRALESLTVEQWLRRWSGAGTFAKFWRPLLRSKLGESYHETSAAFIWATIARLYAARKAGLAEERFGYVSGGYQRVLDAFQEKLSSLGVSVHTASPVTDAAPCASGIELTTAGQSGTYQRAVLTLASPQLRFLPQLFSTAEQQLIATHDYLGVVCASVLLPKALSEFYVTNLVDEGFPFTGVIEMTALVDPAELNGHHLVYLPRYASADDEFWDKSTAEIRAEFIPALQHIHPQLTEQDVLAFEVSKAKLVMPIPKLHASTNMLPIRCQQQGLFVANSSQILNGTLNVNETLKLADIAAQEVLNG